MASREKIIVSVTAVLALWGLFEWVQGGRGKREPATKGDTIVVADLAANDFVSLQSILPSSNVVVYLERAAAPSTGNPFMADVQVPAATTNSIAVAPKSIEFIYSGHIKAGSRKIAIINGQEYGEGEILSTGDYVVEKVSQDKVLLRSKKNGETKEIGVAK